LTHDSCIIPDNEISSEILGIEDHPTTNTIVAEDIPLPSVRIKRKHSSTADSGYYESDNEIDNESEESDSDDVFDDGPDVDWKYKFPTRKARKKWRKYSYLLNMRHLAKLIVNKDLDTTITIGVDDTVKNQGAQRHDVKTTHFTVTGADRNRKTYTTGFIPTPSHKTKDQTVTIRFILKLLACTASTPEVKYSVQDIIDHLDFWMGDRASENDLVLDELNVDEARRLKCNDHVVLCIDEAINAILLEVEDKIGRDKLIGGASSLLQMFKSKQCLAVVALIATAKALSPSHVNMTYTLHDTLNVWKRDNNEVGQDWKRFVSNRFGRVPALATIFVETRSALQRFMDEVIDEQSNRLVQALHVTLTQSGFSCPVRSIIISISP
jgi:hypothetical protein